ncbi:WecE Predicted pyridoxal phosphate-dependent enzyme apparently involved in regulation of cell wall biogenesis [Candidatus Pelagibacterales bacterium]
MKIKKKSINVLKPIGDSVDIKLISKVIRSGWWGNGPLTQRLEEKFKKLTSKKYAIATNSNTSGLDMVIKAYNLQGSDILSPTNSFATTAIVPLWNNCNSILCDVEEQTLNISINSIRKNLTKNTKAIIVVNNAGILANIAEIRKVFKGLIIEDCAHSAYIKGAGEQSDVAIWSFQAVKTIPAGDGGMITLNSKKIYKKLKALSWFGIPSTYKRVGGNKKGYTWNYDIKTLGYKSYMTDLTASLCLTQMSKLNKNLKKRIYIRNFYKKNLTNHISFLSDSNTVQHMIVKVKNLRVRDSLINFLRDKKISTSVHYKPIHLFTLFKKKYKQKGIFPIANKMWKKILSLPCHPGITKQDLKYICFWINKFFEKTV